MKCKNPHCKGTQFIGVIEMDDKRLVGVKCENCGARYTMKDIDVLKSVKREGYWNSVQWELGVIK